MNEHEKDSPFERETDAGESGPEPQSGGPGSPAQAPDGDGDARASATPSGAGSGADADDAAGAEPAGTTRIPSGPANDDWWFDKDQEPGSDADDGTRRRPRWRAVAAAGVIAVAALAGIGAVRAGSDDATTAISDQGPGGQMPGDGQGASGAPSDGAFPGGYGGDGFPGGDGGSGGMGRPGVFGTVTAIDQASFEVETPEGETVTVTVTDDTELRERTADEAGTADDQSDGTDDETDRAADDLAEAELSDLEVGDDVMVMGEADDDGDVTAADVVFGDLPDGGRMGGPPPNGQTGNLPSRPDDSDDGTRHGGSSDDTES